MNKIEESTIEYQCHFCLKEITFSIPDSIRENPTYPFKLMNTHGNPAHKLVIEVNKHLQVASFEIEELVSPNLQSKKSEIRTTFDSLGIDNVSTDLYLLCMNQGPMTIGEISIFVNLPEENVQKRVLDLIQLGLFKEIISSKHYYEALPPYAAINSQLSEFSNMLELMQETLPRDIQMSFGNIAERAEGVQQFRFFVHELHNLRSRLSTELSEETTHLNQALDGIQHQEVFLNGIKALKEDSLSILDEHYISLFNAFENLKIQIASNLDKLHLGILVNTVESVIEKIVDQKLESIKNSFERNFSRKFEKMLDGLTEEIQELAGSAQNIDQGVKTSTQKFLQKFDVNLKKTEKSLDTISGNLVNSMDMVQTNFSDEMLVTLDDVLNQIQKQIVVQKATIEEFWKSSKQIQNVTMQDVWFVRSPEGIRAHINDTVRRVKMRLLLVVPSLNELEIETLKNIPQKINIRICAAIGTKSKENLAKIHFIKEHPNMTFRIRKLQNLWGIQRDYEEIILGIVNKGDEKEISTIEVVGIGSVLTEHIKIFVPVLEEAWVSANKNLEVFTQPENFTEVSIPISPNQAIERVHNLYPVQISTPVSASSSTPIKITSTRAKVLSKKVASKSNIKSGDAKLSKIKLEDVEINWEQRIGNDLISSQSQATPENPIKEKQPLQKIELEKPKVSKKHKKGKKYLKTKEIQETEKTETPSPSPKVDTPTQPKLDKKSKRDQKPVVNPFDPAYRYYKHAEEIKDQKTQPSDIASFTDQKPRKKIGDQKKTSVKLKAKKNKFIEENKSAILSKEMSEAIDLISKNIDNIEVTDLLNALLALKEEYANFDELTRTTNEINNWYKDLKGKPILDDFKRNMIRKRIEKWRNSALDILGGKK